MNDTVRRIAENVEHVRSRIAEAAKRSGRPKDSVQLVAVTKYVSPEVVAALAECGCTELGESRPQDLWAKAAGLDQPAVHWHLIGHLQRNKIRRTLPLVRLIHSVDSRRLLAALEEEAALAGSTVEVLLEVNVSQDITKTGLPPTELKSIVEQAGELSHVVLRGLMGMASLDGGEKAARRDFVRLRELRDGLARHCPPGVVLADLSMGMSSDFGVAIDEGATIVRVGSALFEGVES